MLRGPQTNPGPSAVQRGCDRRKQNSGRRDTGNVCQCACSGGCPRRDVRRPRPEWPDDSEIGRLAEKTSEENPDRRARERGRIGNQESSSMGDAVIRPRTRYSACTGICPSLVIVVAIERCCYWSSGNTFAAFKKYLTTATRLNPGCEYCFVGSEVKSIPRLYSVRSIDWSAFL